MRSIWNGAISFGLVSIPIKLVNATENHSISFRQIHTEDGGRIRYRKVCELDGAEVTTAEIGKAYEEADGSVIPITDEDLATLPLPTAKTIEIVAFVPAAEIDPLQMDTAYYLSANGVPAAKPYTLLREALKRSRKVAIAKFALRGRERLGMLRVVGDVIAMHGLLWPDEIRSAQEVAPQTAVTVREAELDLADALMDTLGSVDLDDLHDDYRTAVEEMIAAKASGQEPQAPASEPSGQVIDLMAALENSVRAAQRSRGESPRDTEQGAEQERSAAKVTQLRSRSGATEPKAVGGKKSTSTRTPAKNTAAARKSAGRSPAGGAGAKSNTTKSAAKSTERSGKATPKTTRKAAAKSADKSTTGARGGTAKKAAAKKAVGGRKRTSA
ncbi:Ku protein [Streptomyces sp. NPDC006879]|uniref:non-homologous end joining protein Ku n=1 Tax=Streptomyces sp. NPDC006879 TaxID=3364767 RepID=UPI00369AEDE1